MGTNRDTAWSVRLAVGRTPDQRGASIETPWRRVPPLSEAVRLAAAVRATDRDQSDAFNVEAYCRRSGIAVCDDRIGSGRGGHEALLVPTDAGSFRIIVDSTMGRTRARRDPVQHHRRRFRIAHELGHTLFYATSAGRPVRLFEGGSQNEEDFCDEFARSLLAPSPRTSVSAGEVVALHQRYEVSVEVAARSAAASLSGPRIALWWWPEADEFPPGVLEQWTSDDAVSRDLGVIPYKATPRRLAELLAAACQNGMASSAALLPERRQALAVVSR